MGLPNMSNAPSKLGDASVSFVPAKPVVVLTELSQKALGVDKVMENTPKLVFYTTKPTAGPDPITPYFVKAPKPGGGFCMGIISVRAGVAQDTVKKMATSLQKSAATQ